MVLIADLVLIILSIVVLTAASIFDIKTKEIPDTLSYGFIVAALGVRLLFSFYHEFSYFYFGLLGFGAMVAIGLVMYYTKQWGGGDSKLLMGLGASFGTFMVGPIHFLAILLLVILFVGGGYALAWGVVIYFKNYNKAKLEMKKLVADRKRERLLLLALASIVLASIFFFPQFKAVLGVITLLIVLLFYLNLFARVVHNVGFVQHVALSKVTEGDWLAKDVVYKGKIICSAKKPCIDQKQLAILKGNNIKKVWIKVGIPFVPAMLLSTIVSVVIMFVY